MLLELLTDTLPRYRGSVVKRAWYPSIAPRCVSMWLKLGKDALIDRRRDRQVRPVAARRAPSGTGIECVSEATLKAFHRNRG
jgi:hypothetical protein